jgi:hypothetical protein
MDARSRQMVTLIANVGAGVHARALAKIRLKIRLMSASVALDNRLRVGR